MEFKLPLSFSNRPLYVQILFTFFAFLIMVVLSSFFADRIVRANLVRNVESVLDYVESQIYSDLLESRTILDEFAQTTQNLVRGGYGREKMSAFTADISSHLLSIDNDTFSPNGPYGYIERSAEGPFYFNGIGWQPPDDWQPQDRPWYKAAVKVSGRIAETEPYIDAVTGETVLTYSRCIFNEDGSHLGVVAIDVRAGHIGERVANTALTKDGFGVLVSQDLTIIGHMNPDFIGLKMYDPSIPLSFLTDELVRTGKISELEWVNWRGEKVVGFFNTLSNGWRLGLLAIKDLYYQAVYTMALTLTILGSALAAVLIIILIRVDVARNKSDTENKYKSVFLANMSHEIRTPLNVVIGLADLILEDDNLDEHITNNLIKISNAGSTLLSIVNDILDFSKIESGKLTLSPVEYFMSSLLNDIVTLTITRLGEKPIKFRLNINDDLPRKLYGDDLRVKQIFTNLLSNAVKYTRKGSIELSVRCTRENAVVWMDVAVTDTGMGIPKNDLNNLFLDYYQVDSKANRHVEGTGLGLPITKRLIEMMDGEIGVESELGKGSMFRFRIKQGFVDYTPLGPDVSEKLRTFCYIDDKRTVTKKLVRLNLNYARVLVVDDMETNLDVAVGLLHKYKMEVDCLTNGPDAIERIRGGAPVYNAIFMDHMMPGMDGVETADRIRALGTEYARKIPIIALTANAIHGTDKMFYAHDFQAFVTKPIDVMELDNVLRKWVRDKTREDVPISGDSSGDERITIEIPGVDTQKALSLYAGDTKVYLNLLHSYAAKTPGVLDKMRNVTLQNLPDYVVTVHGLKGTSAGIGAEAIREQAFDLEQKSRAGNLQGVLAKNGQLIADTEIIVANVKEWLDKNDVHAAKPRLKAPDRGLLAQLRHNCENYDVDGIEEVMSKLEGADYEEDADLIPWIREKIEVSKLGDIAQRLGEV